MASKVAREQTGNLRRTSTWAGLRAGDAVVIDVEREKRNAYVFVAYARNLATGDEWVEVRGGRKGEQKDRSFKPEVVFPAAAKRGAKLIGPSLFDAPQLPFD